MYEKYCNEDVVMLYEYYSNEVIRLLNICERAKNKIIKSKLFNRAIKLKEQYDWTYDDIFVTED